MYLVLSADYLAKRKPRGWRTKKMVVCSRVLFVLFYLQLFALSKTLAWPFLQISELNGARPKGAEKASCGETVGPERVSVALPAEPCGEKKLVFLCKLLEKCR